MNKQEIVYNFLLMPIKNTGKIMSCKANSIITTQTYHCNYDPDMSDIAIAFYKIIYGIDKLIEDGKLTYNKELAGDTMCSFNTIANCIPEAGNSAKQRTPYINWPDYLKNYYDCYHCMANLWLLPLWIGRSYPKMEQQHRWASKSKNGINDYMDRFLLFLKNGNYPKFTNQYEIYGKNFPSFDDFCKKHYLMGPNCYVEPDGTITEYSQDGSPEKIIKRMADLIKARAELISKDQEKCDKLFLLWQRLS